MQSAEWLDEEDEPAAAPADLTAYSLGALKAGIVEGEIGIGDASPRPWRR
jgi:hypothetical protein